jgi:hypothetical protein
VYLVIGYFGYFVYKACFPGGGARENKISDLFPKYMGHRYVFRLLPWSTSSRGGRGKGEVGRVE